jgi:hypothetical protein
LVLVHQNRGFHLLFLTRFPDANGYSLRITSGAGLRGKSMHRRRGFLATGN